jgi:hypothetical protein
MEWKGGFRVSETQAISQTKYPQIFFDLFFSSRCLLQSKQFHEELDLDDKRMLATTNTG